MAINLGGIYLNILEIPITFILLSVIHADISLKGSGIILGKAKSFHYYHIFILLFLCSILISVISAIDETLILKSFIKWIEIYAVSVCAFLFIRNINRFSLVYWLLIFSTFLSILITLYKIISGDLSIFAYRIFPGYDSLFCYALVLPWAFTKKKLPKVIMIIALLSAILSLSRGVWIGLLVVTISYLKFSNKKIPIKFILLILVILIINVLVFGQLNELLTYRMSELFSISHISNVERVVMLKYALLGFSSSPVWGIGALNFSNYIISEGHTRGIVADDIAVLEPHNFFIQTLSEEGILGFVFIFLFLLNLYIIIFKSQFVNNSKWGKYYSYIIGLKLMYIAIAIDLMFGFIANQFRFNLALFLGLILSLTKADLFKSKKT
ncbi:MAG: hypothetical protein GF353_17195 [Candidatus Lokiarchaeota archaeon]|nr:hypothetical protein [Candidatus Lokiarchaeota archaeon]